MTNVGKQLGRQVTASPARLDEVSRRFTARAESSGLVDVFYSVMDSPVGKLVLAATPRGLARVAFTDGTIDDVLDQLARTISPRILGSPARLDGVKAELDDYFEGRRRRFEVPLDLGAVTGFGRRVLMSALDIPYGATASYRQVAEAAGSPRATRAAGSALGRNPIPIVVPCHRVLRSGGALGGYGGGLDRKRLLLRIEGVEL